MKQIRKGRGPRQLTQYAKQGGKPAPSYSELPPAVRTQLRARLLQVQRGLCCYCQCSLDPKDFKVEHFKPQSLYPQLDLSWGNLWAAWARQPRASRGPDLRHP